MEESIRPPNCSYRKVTHTMSHWLSAAAHIYLKPSEVEGNI